METDMLMKSNLLLKNSGSSEREVIAVEEIGIKTGTEGGHWGGKHELGGNC